MTRAYQGLGTRKTPQSRPIPGSGQTPNSAGGYTWTVDCWTRLDRFLVLGSEGGTYYIGERDLTLENVGALRECLTLDGPRTVRRIAEISTSGRAAKNTPAIFGLAVACASTDKDTKTLALNSIPLVCRTGTHLFQFATLISDFRGWGRSLRRGIGAWYAQDPGDLAFQAIKYRQREGWTHKDMLRKAHPARTVSSGNPTIDEVSPLHERLYNWMVRRESLGDSTDWEDSAETAAKAEQIVTAFERAMAAGTPRDTAALVRAEAERGFNIPREALKPEHLNEEVWTALVETGMPMTALIRNLATLTRKDVIKPLDPRTAIVCAQITDGERLRKARVHPYAILLALATYGSGGTYGLSRGEAYTPVSAVMDALDGSFYSAFGNVTPTNKRVMLALDVSGSMSAPILGSVKNGHMQPVPLSAREGSAAMAMVTKAVEPNCMTVAFASDGWVFRKQSARFGWSNISDDIQELHLSGRRSLRDVVNEVERLPMGGTDCALPMLYASANKIEVDAFVTYTDSETWAGDPHPNQALQAYREWSGIPAKQIVVAMSSNGFSIADPNDAGSLDVVGFDTNTPQVISDFVSD